MLSDLLIKQNMSIYKLSKISGIPYTTVNDLVNERTDIKKINSETLYKLSTALKVKMEELLFVNNSPRIEFSLYRSNMCHELKRLGDLDFILEMLKKDLVTEYFNRNWQFEGFYLLAMIDYLSKKHNIPLYNKYDKYRSKTLNMYLYPPLYSLITDEKELRLARKEMKKGCIPEFLKYKILEKDIYDVA